MYNKTRFILSLILIAFLALPLIATDAFARGGGGKGGSHSGHSKGGDTHVRSYTKKDGTHVQPHMRTSPNSSRRDNYSTKGNVNPYTGKEGTKDPFSR